jgi:hypothetical protein
MSYLIGNAPLKRAKLQFELAADDIIGEWVKRRGAQPGRRAESPNAWFKKEAYGFLCPYAELKRHDVLEAVAKDRSKRLLEEARQNPFKLGLLAMFADDSLSKSDRHVFGNQMLYAWRHHVPADFLNAFLAVSGGPAAVAKKLKDCEIEPGFEERVEKFTRR